MFAHKRTILLSAPAVQNGFRNPPVWSFVSVAFIRNFTHIPSAGNPGNVVIILARKHTDSESKFEDLVRPPELTSIDLMKSKSTASTNTALSDKHWSDKHFAFQRSLFPKISIKKVAQLG